jgi:hypothetical protein
MREREREGGRRREREREREIPGFFNRPWWRIGGDAKEGCRRRRGRGR